MGSFHVPHKQFSCPARENTQRSHSGRGGREGRLWRWHGEGKQSSSAIDPAPDTIWLQPHETQLSPEKKLPNWSQYINRTMRDIKIVLSQPLRFWILCYIAIDTETILCLTITMNYLIYLVKHIYLNSFIE